MPSILKNCNDIIRDADALKSQYDERDVAKVESLIDEAAAALRIARMILDPEKQKAIHLAQPSDPEASETSCTVCKNLCRKVHGGHGMVYVHSATGLKFGPGRAS